jgi:hypothetical protein
MANWGPGVACGSSAHHSLAVAGVEAIADGSEVDPVLVAGGDFGDPDHDGISNIMEYAFGLDPLANSAGQLPHGRVIDGSFAMSFSQPAGVSGVIYGVEWSATLEPGSWRDVPDSGSGDQHVFSVPMEGRPRVFVRLKVGRE